MRSFACRRLGLLALVLGRGQAKTTIAQATFTLSHHGGHRAHAALSSPRAAGGDGRPRIISSRRQTTDCCGPAGENVRPSTKTAGIAELRLFARRGVGVEPVCAADALGRPNLFDARDARPAKPDARAAIALTRDRGRTLMAPATCLDARVAIRGASLISQTAETCRCITARFEQRQETSWRPPARRPGAGELAARQFATAASPPPNGRRRKPPRCLKPRATSLEAIGRRVLAPSGAVDAQPGAAVTSTSLNRAPRCRRSRLLVNAKEMGSPLPRGGLGDQVDEAFQAPA